MRNRWNKLRYWQKGAILGAGFHVSAVLFIIILALILIPGSSPPGSGDLGPVSAWILLALYGLLEFIPLFLLRTLLTVTTGTVWKLPGDVNSLSSILTWILYLIYATFFYGMLGIISSKIFENIRRIYKTKDQ